MQIHVTKFNNSLKFTYLTNRLYKKLITYINCNDNIGLCEYINTLTDAKYNIYQKFVLMLYIYKHCINDKIVYEYNNKKYIYYLDELINAMPQINDEHWVSINEEASVLIKLPNVFYNNIDLTQNTPTTANMNDYFINNCITALKVGDNIYEITPDDVEQLPANFLNTAVTYIRNLDTTLQNIKFLDQLGVKISMFSMLSIITVLFKLNIHMFYEFEYTMRKYAKLTNFDELTYKESHEMADIYTHDLQEQKSAIENAKQSINNH